MNVETSFALQEELLQSWIDMSLLIRGNRLVSGFSFNEIIVCRILYLRMQQGGEPVTATELCTRMSLLKSQINKVLTSMESSGLIERVRSENDRRRMEIRLCEKGLKAYEEEHERILQIACHVHARLGEQRSRELSRMMNDMVEAVREMEPSERKGKMDERSNCD